LARTFQDGIDESAQWSGDGRSSGMQDSVPNPLRSISRAAAPVVCGTVLIAVHASFYGNWIMDDAGITFAYARSIAEGNGPVLQPGADPVEGFSNPAWMMLLVLGRLLGLFDHGTIFGVPDYVLFPKALALACCIGILGLFYTGARSLSTRPGLITLGAGAGLAATPSFVIWSFSGLENSLYSLAVVALAVVMLRATVADRLLATPVAVSTGLLAALAALTRPDGLIYAAAYPVVLLLLARRPDLRPGLRAALLSGLAFAIPVGAYATWRWSTFGLLLPNTAVAKSQPLPELQDLGRAGELVQYIGWLSVLLVVGCIGLFVLQPSRIRSGLVALMTPLALAATAFCILPPDWMGQYRFASPVWALGALVAVLVIVETLRDVSPRTRISLGLLIAVAATFSVSKLYEEGKAYSLAVKTPLCVVAERDGRTMNGFADLLSLDRASAGVIDLGGQALTTRLHLVDLAGLGDRRTAAFIGRGDVAGLRDFTFDEAKPDFITLIGIWGDVLGLPADPRFERDYHLLYHSPPAPPNAFLTNHVGYWVRKELVPSTAKLAELQAYAETRLTPILARNVDAPRRTCGPVLRRGQT